VIFKPPRQRRSQESLERILDAAESLIRERGFDNMTIAEVVERSDSSVGSLYARFGNKLTLLRAVQVRYHARVESSIALEVSEGHARGETLQAAVARVVDVLSEYLLSEPELYRAFIVGAVFDPQVRAQGEKASAERGEVVGRALMEHREQIRHPDPVLAVRWVYSHCMAVLRERITYGEGAKLSGGFTDETMVRELTRTAVNYLMCEGSTWHSALA
jgi:AcrR family transcriptional regulator